MVSDAHVQNDLCYDPYARIEYCSRLGAVADEGVPMEKISRYTPLDLLTIFGEKGYIFYSVDHGYFGAMSPPDRIYRGEYVYCAECARAASAIFA